MLAEIVGAAGEDWQEEPVIFYSCLQMSPSIDPSTKLTSVFSPQVHLWCPTGLLLMAEDDRGEKTLKTFSKVKGRIMSRGV